MEVTGVTETKKRKKKLKKEVEEEGLIVKKKRKIEKGVKKEQTDETKEVRKKKKLKSSDLSESKSVDGDKKLKKKLEKSAKRDSSKSKEEKTMDYKQFHLKKMKEKWKNKKAKRIRQKKDEKTTDEQLKTKKVKREEAAQLKEKPTEKQAKKFGTCDFSELQHYWNEFATSSLTAVEREELQLNPKQLILNEKGRSPVKFLSKNVPDWSEWLQKKIPNGSPQMIVLCSSALRAVDLNRDLSSFKGKNCRTTKLIAKDKAKSQAEFLTKNAVRFAIGTPHRFDLLLSHDNLKLDECRVIALDWSFEDVKKRRLITIQEIRKDIFELFRKHLLPLLKSRTDISLVLF